MSTEPEKARETENRDKENGEETKGTGQFLDPKRADAIAQTEFQNKYGFKKPSAVAQRKISEGGRQYFDSGDYMQASKKDRKAIASQPHVINPPTMAQLMAKRTHAKAHPSKLAPLGTHPSKLAPLGTHPSKLAPLGTQPSQLTASPAKSPLAQ